MSIDQTPATVEALEALAAEVAHLHVAHAAQAQALARVNAAHTALKAEMAALRRSVSSPESATTPPSGEGPALCLPPALQQGRTRAASGTATSRRALLKLGGAAAAAGVLLSETSGAGRAAPAHMDTITFERSASGLNNIAIQGDGSSGAVGVVGVCDSGIGVQSISDSGYGVYAQSFSGYGVFAHSNSSTGVHAVTSAGLAAVVGDASGSTTADGVHGSSDTHSGVWGSANSGYGVYGSSTSGIGGGFGGGRAQLSLVPFGSAGAPSTGAYVQGDIYLDNTATLFVCTAGGTPGTWGRLGVVSANAKGGTTTYLSAPVRLLDARSGATSGLVNRGVLAANEIYSLSVAGLGGSGIPSGAQGLICNVTVLGPSGSGNLSLYPTGAATPTTASMTFLTGAFLANGVNVAIGTAGKVNLQNQSSGTTPLVLDAVQLEFVAS